MLQTYAERLLANTLEDLVRRGTLDVTLPDGRRLAFGDGTLPRAAIRFTDTRAVLALLMDPDLRLGELFMDQRLVVDEGSIYDVLELLLRDADAVRPGVMVRVLDAMRMSIRRFLQNNRPGRARANVAHHYDLDDRLYSLFLDEQRQYSCAYFEHPGQDLESAQRAKQRHIAAKLLVEPATACSTSAAAGAA